MPAHIDVIEVEVDERQQELDVLKQRVRELEVELDKHKNTPSNKAHPAKKTAAKKR